MNRLCISPEVQKDLSEIKEYIVKELDNPTAALRIASKITKHMRELLRFPQTGAPLSSVVQMNTDYRFLVCGNYTVFYRYEDESIFVDRVLYGRRDYMKILFGEILENEIYN
jgi:toxin ParE1/3/4